MPELPEVETMVRGIRPAVEGKRIVEFRRAPCSCRAIPLPPGLAAIKRRCEGQTVAAVRRRASGLLEQLELGTTPQQLRSLRVIEVLEHTGTPATRELLQELAGGAAAARQAREAKGALDRLDAIIFTVVAGYYVWVALPHLAH